MNSQPFRVALVSAPFSDCEMPALGLSLLKAALLQRGVPTDILYLNLHYAQGQQYEDYDAICRGEPMVHALAGEWVFSQAAWGPDEPRDRTYLNEVIRGRHPHHRSQGTTREAAEALLLRLHRLRSGVDAFIDRSLTDIAWNEYSVVGFSTTFQQNNASFALARRIKAAHPQVTIVFGGANCEGGMGQALLENLPFVDAVCIGEGDWAFPEFVDAKRRGTFPPEVPGMLTAVTGPDARKRPVTVHMDALPLPDFGDYFDQLGAMPSLGSRIRPRLVFESSRGCWWGQRSHCTFCGLNGEGMAFREKSVERVLGELHELVNTYGSHTRSLVATDNIMPRHVLRDALPKLKTLDLELFYEVKSNLRYDELIVLRDAGVRLLQPGIESLSTPVLSRMRKGVTGLQNVQTLKWCRELGLTPSWNYLTGFPGERQEDYAGQEIWLAQLAHLTPPQYCGPIRFDRFSPYHNEPAGFGLGHLKPYRSYRWVYPGLPEDALEEMAYFFVADDLALPNLDFLHSAIAEWKANVDAHLLSFQVGHSTMILDSRLPMSPPLVYELAPSEATLLQACHSITTRAQLHERLGHTEGYTRWAVDDALDKLTKRRLLLWEEHKCLALTVGA